MCTYRTAGTAVVDHFDADQYLFAYCSYSGCHKIAHSVWGQAVFCTVMQQRCCDEPAMQVVEAPDSLLSLLSSVATDICPLHTAYCCKLAGYVASVLQVLSTLAWSFAKLSYFDQGLWNGLASRTIAARQQLHGAELAQLCWAFGQVMSHQAAEDGIGQSEPTEYSQNITDFDR